MLLLSYLDFREQICIFGYRRVGHTRSSVRTRISRPQHYGLRTIQIHKMLIDNEYEHLFNEVGIKDKESQALVLEYIVNLARLGIECVNYKHKTLNDNE